MTYKSAWDFYGVCSCGWRQECFSGDLFFITVPCCPACGADKEEFRRKKLRQVISIGFWFFNITWEEKE